MKRSLWTLTLAIATAACSGDDTTTHQEQDPPALEQRLAGRWTSESCEAYAGQGGTMTYLKRDFTNAGDSWKLTVTIYGDSACTGAFLAVDVGGDFHVGEASANVAGATEVDYGFAYRRVTPLYQDATGLLATCGDGHWTVGEQQDLSDAGCPALGIVSVSECPTERDLNRIEGDLLYYGDRSGDLCKTRPAKLGAFAVKQLAP